MASKRNTIIALVAVAAGSIIGTSMITPQVEANIFAEPIHRSYVVGHSVLDDYDECLDYYLDVYDNYNQLLTRYCTAYQNYKDCSDRAFNENDSTWYDSLKQAYITFYKDQYQCTAKLETELAILAHVTITP